MGVGITLLVCEMAGEEVLWKEVVGRMAVVVIWKEVVGRMVVVVLWKEVVGRMVVVVIWKEVVGRMVVVVIWREVVGRMVVVSTGCVSVGGEMVGRGGVGEGRRERDENEDIIPCSAKSIKDRYIPSTGMCRSLMRVPLVHLTWLPSVTSPDWTRWNNTVMLSSLQSQRLECRVLGKGEFKEGMI